MEWYLDAGTLGFGVICFLFVFKGGGGFLCCWGGGGGGLLLLLSSYPHPDTTVMVDWA